MTLQPRPRATATMALLLCAAMIMAALAGPAAAFETRARAAFVLDQTTGTVLLDKNGDVPLPPASMSKLMTLYLTFEAIRDGRLRLDEKLPVSRHAMSYGGSTMFLDTTDRVRVEDLLRGVIVLSGNDATVVLAETLSPDGTEAGFARYMTRRARELGLTHSVFVNSNGWPAEGHVMSMHDLVRLADRIITDFPEFYPLFSEREFKFDGRAPKNVRNRNPLLGLGIGADGLKTGHTVEAGYGLVGSARQGDRRIIFALSGLPSAESRAEEGQRIINWAFRQFALKTVLRAGDKIGRAEVWMGSEPAVDLVVPEDVAILVPAGGSKRLVGEIVYQGPLNAPVRAGEPVARLVLRPEGLPPTEIRLVPAADVAQGGFLARIAAAARQVAQALGARLENAGDS